MADFLMPSLGADMEAGTLVAWRKQPGEPVARGEIIAEVETDKGVIEIECFLGGVVREQLVQPGTKVPVGTRLATIEEGAGGKVVESRVPEPGAESRAPAPPIAEHGTSQRPATPSTTPPARATPAARRLMRERGVMPDHGSGRHGVITRADVQLGSQTPSSPAVAPVVPAAAETRMRASPLARRIAGELGVSLGELRGSAPDGSIVAADIRARAPAPAPSKPTQALDAARMRAAIGQAMARSKREIPHFYLSHTVSLQKPLAWLSAENERRSMEERVLAGVLFVRAVALAAAQTPELNGYFTERGPEPCSDVHVGVAIALRGGGLVAPAIMHADRLSLSELNRKFKDIVLRARKGELRSSEMASATITVTSLGERGVETVLPVIIPPQVAMVGFGAISERVLVVAGSVVARPAVTVTLAADHRVSDGHRGAAFLNTLQTILQEEPS